MPMTDDEIFEKVQAVLEDALGVDDDEVTMEATLGPDLGAESIDYLDIVFRLEKAFGLKIDQAELMPNDVLTDPAYVENGKITDRWLGRAEDQDAARGPLRRRGEPGRGGLREGVHGEDVGGVCEGEGGLTVRWFFWRREKGK